MTKIFRLLVCGGRDFGNIRAEAEQLERAIERMAPQVIITGGAGGADSVAVGYAMRMRIPYWVFPANWYAHGKAAGPKRNQSMIDLAQPSAVLAAPGGVGTADMLRRAEAAGIKIHRLSEMP